LQLEAVLYGNTTRYVYFLSDTTHTHFLFSEQQSISGPSADEALGKEKLDKMIIYKRHGIATKFTMILFVKNSIGEVEEISRDPTC
jgi:hypothetical protein